MSNLIFTYQHTCRKGKQAYILEAAAFRSAVKKKNGISYIPFLGSGHYYWEENHDAAHRWGKRQYPSDYTIVEYLDSNIPLEELLDFLNRRHLSYYNELISIYKVKRPGSEKWLIGQWIEFFKTLEQMEKGKFPFKYFRADENFPEPKENDNYKKKALFNFSGYYAFMNPHIILCAIHKNDLNCISKTIIY